MGTPWKLLRKGILGGFWCLPIFLDLVQVSPPQIKLKKNLLSHHRNSSHSHLTDEKNRGSEQWCHWPKDTQRRSYRPRLLTGSCTPPWGSPTCHSNSQSFLWAQLRVTLSRGWRRSSKEDVKGVGRGGLPSALECPQKALNPIQPRAIKSLFFGVWCPLVLTLVKCSWFSKKAFGGQRELEGWSRTWVPLSTLSEKLSPR